MRYLSRLTSLLLIPTSLTVKVLRLAAFSFANATISTSPRKLFVTSYGSSSTWTISHLTTSTTYKNTVLLWAPKWLLHLPTFFLPNSNMTRSLTHLIYLIHGSDFWTIFSLFGPKVQINWKRLSIISITYIPPSYSLVRIPSLIFHCLMWWSHLRMVS